MEEAMKTIRNEMAEQGGGVFLIFEPRPGSDLKPLNAHCFFTGEGVTPELVGKVIDDMKSSVTRRLQEK